MGVAFCRSIGVSSVPIGFVEKDKPTSQVNGFRRGPNYELGPAGSRKSTLRGDSSFP